MFPENIGSKLSIDETSLSNGELYTIVTNKQAKGRKGAIVAIVEGVKSADVSGVLNKISLKERKKVKEVTLDMSNSMDAIIRCSFPDAKIVTDRFHVQQLVSEAVQEIRMTYRRKAIKEENEVIKKIQEKNKKKNNKEKREFYKPDIYKNGDTKKQLLARSRYLLFKPKNQWYEQQKVRSEILFKKFPDLKKAHELSMMFRNCYECSKTISQAKMNFKKWYKKIEEKNIESFLLPAETIRLHETTILNYFVNRSTNASAESFNAKLKGFRSVVKGVRDKKFFLFRIAKLYG